MKTPPHATLPELPTITAEEKRRVASSRAAYQSDRLTTTRPYLLVGGGQVVARKDMTGYEAKDLNAHLLFEFQQSMIDGRGTIPLWRWNEDRTVQHPPLAKVGIPIICQDKPSKPLPDDFMGVPEPVTVQIIFPVVKAPRTRPVKSLVKKPHSFERIAKAKEAARKAKAKKYLRQLADAEHLRSLNSPEAIAARAAKTDKMLKP